MNWKTILIDVGGKAESDKNRKWQEKATDQQCTKLDSLSKSRSSQDWPADFDKYITRNMLEIC